MHVFLILRFRLKKIDYYNYTSCQKFKCIILFVLYKVWSSIKIKM